MTTRADRMVEYLESFKSVYEDIITSRELDAFEAIVLKSRYVLLKQLIKVFVTEEL